MWTWKSIPAELWLFQGYLQRSVSLSLAQNCAISVLLKLLEKQINLAFAGINLVQPEAAEQFWQAFISWVSSPLTSVGSVSAVRNPVSEETSDCPEWEQEHQSLTSESSGCGHFESTAHMVEYGYGICCLLFLLYLWNSAGKPKIVMLGKACPFWLGQLLNIYLIKELGLFGGFEFTEIPIKANLSRKVSRALIFQSYFKI